MLVFHATYHAQSMKNLDFRNQEFSDFVKISTLARKEGHCICNYAPQYHCSQVYVKIQILCGPITMQGMRSSLKNSDFMWAYYNAGHEVVALWCFCAAYIGFGTAYWLHLHLPCTASAFKMGPMAVPNIDKKTPMYAA